MLYQLGPVRFEVAPFNPIGITRDTEASYVDKQVIGRRPPLEFTGDGPEVIKIEAKLFPRKFGGLNALAALNAARASGEGQYLMRADGAPLGFFVLTNVTEKSAYLDRNGVGQVIEVEITLCADSGGPSYGGFAASMLGMIRSLF